MIRLIRISVLMKMASIIAVQNSLIGSIQANSGWKSREDLLDYLCAADMYLQPGSVSATLQNAICCGTPVMIYPHNSYDEYARENCIRVSNEEDMRNMFQDISEGKIDLSSMSYYSYVYARKYLDYKRLAARLYQ